MAQVNRFVDRVALSLAVSALGLAGCGADGNNTPGTGPNAIPAGGGSSTTSGGAVGTQPPVGVSGSVGVGTGNTPGTFPGAGGSSAPTPGAGGAVGVSPPGAGGSVVLPPGAGGSGVPPGAGGSGVPPGAGGSTNGTANGTANDTWSTASNLDANGLLIAPTPDQGFQIATTTFALLPGQEVFKCFHSTFPNTAEFDIGDWESQMAKGSHHFILYRTDNDFVANGTLVDSACTNSFGGPNWLYSAAVPHTHLGMPDGVAMPIAAQQKVSFDMHYINTGTDTLQAHVVLNVTKVKSAQFQKAESQVSFNVNINIPPNGMQTVGGDCTPPSGAKYFMMLTHTHRRGIDASITRKLSSGMMGETLVHTTNWDSPENILWESPPYLTFQAGEKFHYKCSYQNDRASATTVGISAADNEMCMAITYFFPASGNVQACTSDVE
jgi:hypothetical protein